MREAGIKNRKEVVYMLPIRWDPFRDIGSLHRELDNLFRGISGGDLTETGGRSMAMAPVVNAFTGDNVYHVQAELPGVDKDDLDISIEENLLVIRGERKETQEKKERDYFLKESRYGSFIRKMTLPEGVNTDKVHAKCEDGILEITMPIEEKAVSSRKVMIEGKEGKEAKKERKIH